MFAVPATRELRPVGVLLGGSGRARMSTRRTPPLAALMRPCTAPAVQAHRTSDACLPGDSSHRGCPAFGQTSDRPAEKLE